MKKSLLIFLACIYSTTTFSQDAELVGLYYEFISKGNFLIATKKVPEPQNIQSFRLEEALELEVAYMINGERGIIEEGRIFKIIATDAQFYVVEIYEKIKGEEGISTRMLALTVNEFQANTRIYEGEKPKWGFLASAITLPVKVRFGDGNSEINDNSRYLNFEGNMNIGIAAGARWRVSVDGKSYLSVLMGLNIGATKITPETTNSKVEEETNIAILTPMVGVLFEYDDFQVGLFTGWDHISGKLGRSWDYQGKTWLGVGIGYNIFASKNKSVKEKDAVVKKQKQTNK